MRTPSTNDIGRLRAENAHLRRIADLISRINRELEQDSEPHTSPLAADNSKGQSDTQEPASGL
jgi:hypothetical protein